MSRAQPWSYMLIYDYIYLIYVNIVPVTPVHLPLTPSTEVAKSALFQRRASAIPCDQFPVTLWPADNHDLSDPCTLRWPPSGVDRQWTRTERWAWCRSSSPLRSGPRRAVRLTVWTSWAPCAAPQMSGFTLTRPTQETHSSAPSSSHWWRASRWVRRGGEGRLNGGVRGEGWGVRGEG